MPFSDARGRSQRPVGGKEGALLPPSAKMVNRSRTRSSSSTSQIFLAVLSVLATLTYAEIQHGRRLLQSPGWTREIDLVGEAVDDMFGYSVSMSADGKRVAIGATGNDGTGNDAGHVRVYAESSGTWTQVGADIDGSSHSFEITLRHVGLRLNVESVVDDAVDVEFRLLFQETHGRGDAFSLAMRQEQRDARTELVGFAFRGRPFTALLEEHLEFRQAE